MKKITCQFCLQLEAVLTIQGERSSQFVCQCCGEAFEVDHPPKPFRTQARPQEISLAAIGGTTAMPAARSTR